MLSSNGHFDRSDEEDSSCVSLLLTCKAHLFPIPLPVPRQLAITSNCPSDREREREHHTTLPWPGFDPTTLVKHPYESSFLPLDHGARPRKLILRFVIIELQNCKDAQVGIELPSWSTDWAHLRSTSVPDRPWSNVPSVTDLPYLHWCRWVSIIKYVIVTYLDLSMILGSMEYFP